MNKTDSYATGYFAPLNMIPSPAHTTKGTTMYCTIDDLKNALTEDILARLTDENGAEINTTRVNKAIEFASTLIDAHLEGSYPTPININSPLLTGIAVTLATFRLYLDSCGDDAPDSVSTAYTEALNLLVKLQNGELNLKTQRQNETLTNKTPCDKLFSRRFLGGL